MGQGQAEIAIQLLRDCARNGEWLCLKNLHLVTSWLPTLEKVCCLVLSSLKYFRQPFIGLTQEQQCVDQLHSQATDQQQETNVCSI